MAEKNQIENEINLIDFLKIVQKRKKSILAILLIVVLIVTVLSFFWPKTYQSSALLEIAQIDKTTIETPKDVGVWLKQPFILKTLAKNLKMAEKDWLTLQKTIKIQPSEKFLEIKIEAETPEKAKIIGEAVAQLVIERHRQMIATRKEVITQAIQIDRQNIQESEKRINELNKEISQLKKPTTEAQALLFQGYINALNFEKANLQSLREGLLNKEKESIFYETKMVGPIIAPSEPIKPNKKLNIIVSIVLGLLIGIFYAFLAEYFEKNKNKLKV